MTLDMLKIENGKPDSTVKVSLSPMGWITIIITVFMLGGGFYNSLSKLDYIESAKADQVNLDRHIYQDSVKFNYFQYEVLKELRQINKKLKIGDYNGD